MTLLNTSLGRCHDFAAPSCSVRVSSGDALRTAIPSVGGAAHVGQFAVTYRKTLRRCLSVVSLLSVLPLAAAGQQSRAGREPAGFEDYRVAVGRLEGNALRVTLEARPATWRPWGDNGPALDVNAFATPGAGVKVPGPLLRVAAGTPMHVTVRNGLDDTLVVRGLRDRGQPIRPGALPNDITPAFAGDSLVVAPGESAEVRFTPTVPGSYIYYGETFEPLWSATPQPLLGADPHDRGLAGVLVVDPPGEAADPDERILLITAWADPAIPESWLPTGRFMVNGRSWPHTERLEYAQGDTVRWRVINWSRAFHPMHLHGFFFEVWEMTTQTGGSAVPGATLPLPLLVTAPLPPATASRLTWVADEPGNWLFHCHLMRHMSWMQAHPDPADRTASHAHAAAEGVDLLGGLVVGITVNPRPGHAPAADVARRRLRLHIGQRDGVFGTEPGYGFVLQEGPEPPAPDSVRFPGSPILLTRGEPTEIAVFNHADVPLGVHWHGLELESWSDGVPGWSGYPGAIRPAIAPGDSFVVRMTPRRAGTFMYHVHSEPGHHLAQGLYGAFIVLEPGEPWDPETNRLLLLGSLGTGEDAQPAVNGELDPPPMAFRHGQSYRLRFMHISPDDNKAVHLLDGDEHVSWTWIAQDGADLPPRWVRAAPAVRPFLDVGTTFDVLWTPEKPGDMTLRIVTTPTGTLPDFPREERPAHTLDITVRVR